MRIMKTFYSAEVHKELIRKEKAHSKEILVLIHVGRMIKLI